MATTRFPSRWFAAGITATLAVAGACSGSDATPGTTTAADQSRPVEDVAAPSGTTPPSPPQEEVRDLAVSVYFRGFVLHLDEATIRPAGGPSDGSVVFISATAENLVDMDENPPYDLFLEIDGQVLSHDSSQRPTVAGLGSEEALWAFVLDPEHDVDDAVLTFGSSRSTQASVPLGASGEARTNEPLDIDAPAGFTIDDFEVTIDAAEVHFDRPYDHREGLADIATLWFSFTALNQGGGPDETPRINLMLPDGELVVASGEGRSTIDASEPAVVEISFQVPLESSGMFTLIAATGTSEQDPVAEFELPSLTGQR